MEENVNAGIELKEKKKSKLPLIVIIVAVVLAVVAGVGITAYTASPGQRLKRQLELGDRYLAELDYEQAIAAYEEAISIDPKSPQAYRSLTGIYIDTDNEEELYKLYVLACDNLKTEDLESIEGPIRDAVEGWLDELQANGEYDKLIDMAERWGELLPGIDYDKYISAAQQEADRIKAENELLARVYQFMSAGNYEGILMVDGLAEADEVVSNMTGDYIIYAPDGADENYTGTVSGLYKAYSSSGYYGYYFYYGEVKDGIRSGHGISIWRTGMYEYEVFEGEWANNDPNGHGVDTLYYEDGINITVEGNYTNGLQNGTFVWVEEIGNTDVQWVSVNGYAEPIDVEAVRNSDKWWAYDWYIKPRVIDNGLTLYTLGFGEYENNGAVTSYVVFLKGYDPETEYLAAVGYNRK